MQSLRKQTKYNSERRGRTRRIQNDYDEEKDKEYDSTDSLDQLNDNTFIPEKSRPDHMLKETKIISPRKSIRTSAGGKRARAMALLASNTKKSNRKQNGLVRDKKGINNLNKKKYKAICKSIDNNKYITPSIKNRTRSNITSSIKNTSRKIISPTAETTDHLLLITPKKVNKLKNMDTPCTPTPVKLMRSLNVKTPKKKEKKEDINAYNNEYNVKYNNNKNKKNNNLSKYEILLKQTNRLQLPLKWSILLQKFNALESTLALYMRKNSFFVHYQNIQNSVQKICKKKFSETDLQRILTIIPDFYHIQWTANINKNTQKKDLKLTLTALDYDPYNDQQSDQQNDIKKNKGDSDDKLRGIGIKFLNISKLREREKVFRIRLIEYVAYHHERYLIDNILVQFDPLQKGKWHKRFDLENVEDIKISPFPAKPTKNVDEIEKMIIKQKEKLQDIVQKEIEKAKQEKKEKQYENDDVIPKHLKHLSPTFVAKIRAKKKNKIMVTTKSLKTKKENDFQDKEYRLQQLPYLVTLIRTIYVSLKKSSMSCNDLIKLIKKRHRNHHVMNAEIWSQLQLLNDLKSKFFKIKQGPMVKVAKLNKRIAIKEVLHEIKGQKV